MKRAKCALEDDRMGNSPFWGPAQRTEKFPLLVIAPVLPPGLQLAQQFAFEFVFRLLE